jgi:hypothetical protein
LESISDLNPLSCRDWHLRMARKVDILSWPLSDHHSYCCLLPSIVWANRCRLCPRNGLQRQRIVQVHQKGGVLTKVGMLDYLLMVQAHHCQSPLVLRPSTPYDVGGRIMPLIAGRLALPLQNRGMNDVNNVPLIVPAPIDAWEMRSKRQ